MTIPMLTALLSEPARPPAKARPEVPSNRRDEKDFAATMSDGAPARGADPAADPADRPDAVPEGRDGADETAGTPAEDAARRRVTIPDLPPRRGVEPASTGTDAGLAATLQASPDIIAAEGEQAAVTAETQPSRTATTAATTEPELQAAARTGLVPGIAMAATTPAAGALAQSGAPKAAGEADAPGALAQADHRRDAGQAAADARTAAAANPVAQAMRASPQSVPPVPPPSEDRAPARSRDPQARAIEAVAATPAPAPQPNAAQPSIVAQVSILQPAARDAQAAKDKAETVLTLDGEADALRFDLRGGSGSTSTQPGSLVSAMARADLPRGIAMQLGDGIRAMPDRPIDVSLSPEELGRVRLSISTGEGGVTLHVLAERPETLDLMRRHADQLARELADLGFTSIDLSFGKGRDPESRDGDGSSGDDRGRTARTGEDTDAARPAEGPVTRMTLSPTGGLDIRI